MSTAAGSDLTFNWSEKNQSISFNVPQSGYGKGMVSARCAKHPEISNNQSFSFTLKNGKLDFYSTIKGSSGELSATNK